MRLYRYRRIDPVQPEFVHGELIDGSVYACSLDDFNDPFEGRVYNDLKVDSEFGRALVQFLRSRPVPTKEETRIVARAATKSPQLSRVLAIMARQAQLAAEMTDEDIDRFSHMFAQLGGKVLAGWNPVDEFVRQSTSVVCFTLEDLSPTMFAHYAGNHTGICIEYELVTNSHMLRPVEYVHDVPRINNQVLAAGVDAVINPYYFKKGDAWKHEREVRWAMTSKAGIKSMTDAFGARIAGVTLGIKTSPEHTAMICQLAGSVSRFSPFPVRRAAISDATYKLTAIPL